MAEDKQWLFVRALERAALASTRRGAWAQKSATSENRAAVLITCEPWLRQADRYSPVTSAASIVRQIHGLGETLENVLRDAERTNDAGGVGAHGGRFPSIAAAALVALLAYHDQGPPVGALEHHHAGAAAAGAAAGAAGARGRRPGKRADDPPLLCEKCGALHDRRLLGEAKLLEAARRLYLSSARCDPDDAEFADMAGKQLTSLRSGVAGECLLERRTRNKEGAYRLECAGFALAVALRRHAAVSGDAMAEARLNEVHPRDEHHPTPTSSTAAGERGGGAAGGGAGSSNGGGSSSSVALARGRRRTQPAGRNQSRMGA